jgi:LDH2 family malate/lactate/ureidoglycolate dehydrogenase
LVIRVPSADLTSLVGQCFARAGMASGDAERVASVLVDANLRGHDSHGIVRVPGYLRRFAAGATAGAETIGVPQGEGPLQRLDAGAALGPLVGLRGSELAAELAADHGIGLVAVGNSSHFGAAGFFARRLAERDLIGVVATNGPANMAPHGSSSPFLGTNAMAVGLPLGDREQFVLDMSSSAVARGKIIRKRELGEPLEAGLALDADGNPTEDAAAALAGAVLPFAGPKGSGLALAISLAIGMLAGASFDDEAGRSQGDDPTPQDIGHIFLAIDPWRLADREQVESRIAALVERLHSLRPAQGFDRVLYAGERGELERIERLANGVPLAPRELDELAQACDQLGYDELADRARSLLASAAE